MSSDSIKCFASRWARSERKPRSTSKSTRSGTTMRTSPLRSICLSSSAAGAPGLLKKSIQTDESTTTTASRSGCRLRGRFGDRFGSALPAGLHRNAGNGTCRLVRRLGNDGLGPVDRFVALPLQLALPLQYFPVRDLAGEQLQSRLHGFLLRLVRPGLHRLAHEGVVDIDVGAHDVYQV